MGVCTAEDEKNNKKYRKINKIEESKNVEGAGLKINKKISFQNKIIDISLNSKKTIIKLIGEIKEKPIKIKNNIDCIILIMENSPSITLENCKNCSILLAPCSSSIYVENCENLNLISASLNIKILNVKKGNLFIFTNNPAIIKNSEDIYLGNFFFQYTELPEMFINSKLNIWNNKWSLYKDEGRNKNIKYSNNAIKQKVVDKFNIVLNKCYINIDQYQFLPFTYGKKLLNENNIGNNNYINFMIIIKEEDIQENEILKSILPEELENYKINLISTLVLEENNEKIKDLINQLELNKENGDLINYILRKNDKEKSLESFQSSGLKNSENKCGLNEIDLSNNENMNNNYKFLNKGDLLFLWFFNGSNGFKEIYSYFNNFFEQINIDIIKKETFGWDEDKFTKYLEYFFEFEKKI